MKKLHKLSKFLLIPLTVFFALTTNNLAFASPFFTTRYVYVNFTIGEGLSTDGESMNGVLISIYDSRYSIETSSSWNPIIVSCSNVDNTCSKPTFLYYVSAPGYENAQCLVDGVPKAANEQFTVSTLAESPTQIVCTAEKIPETTLNITNPETIQFFNLPTSVNLSINPSANGVFQSTPLNITLGSNYPNGYTLYMDVDTPNLVNPNSTTPLSTLDSTCSADNFTVNRWGYSTDGTLFQPILTSQQLDTVNGPINSRILALTLGAKINLAQPNGSYTGHITFMAIPNLVTE